MIVLKKSLIIGTDVCRKGVRKNATDPNYFVRSTTDLMFTFLARVFREIGEIGENDHFSRAPDRSLGRGSPLSKQEIWENHRRGGMTWTQSKQE